MKRLGQQLARGGTSDVYAYGDELVVKVPQEHVPAHWPAMEAAFTEAVYLHGLPAPRVHGLIEIDGRESILFERLVGPSMWDVMVDRPGDRVALTQQLTQIHRSILSAGIPEGLPDWVGRMESKIEVASQLDDAERTIARDMARKLPRGAALLHGDLHPMNVIMSSSGPRVIDWFDSSIGHPVSDVLRSSWLMRPPEAAAGHAHLPGSTTENARHLQRNYLAEFEDDLAHVESLRPDWEVVIAVGRLSENLEGEEKELLEMWRTRPQPVG